MNQSAQVTLREEKTASPATQKAVSLAPVIAPTVIVVSGVLGAGKTSLLERIINQTEMPPGTKAAIFNEKFEALAKLDASRVRGIETATLGGCACCLSNQELKDTVKKFLGEGRKLIVVEQSGVTDGAELRKSIESEFGKVAYVRLISLVDAERLKAPPAILHASIMAADSVFLSHVGGSQQRIAAGEGLVKSLRTNGIDFVQSSAGDISSAAWDKLLKGNTVKSDGLSVLKDNYPVITPEQARERRTLRDQMMATSLMLYPDVPTQEIVRLISTSPVSISRAKGWMSIGGSYREIQYELKDGGQGVIAFGEPTKEKPSLFEGRPHLFLLSTEGAPPSEHFIKAGIPNFAPSEVEYSIKHYPGRDVLQQSLVSGRGVPISTDGDALVLQAFRLANRLAKEPGLFPAEVKKEFDQAFLRLAKKYVEWRVEVAELLGREPRAGIGADFGERSATLGYSLMWTVCSFAGLLKHPQVNVLDSALKAQPANLLFQGLRDSKRLEINGSQALTPAIINDLAAFVFVGATQLTPRLELKLVTDALGNLESMAKTSKNDQWLTGIQSLRSLLSQKSIKV